MVKIAPFAPRVTQEFDLCSMAESSCFDDSEAPAEEFPPCQHNCWTRARRCRRPTTGLRLRCLVCRSKWTTLMANHKKCPEFYSGKCDGRCGRPHIHARGTVTRAQDNESAVVADRGLRQALLSTAMATTHATLSPKSSLASDLSDPGESEDLKSTDFDSSALDTSVSTPLSKVSRRFRHDPYSKSASTYL